MSGDTNSLAGCRVRVRKILFVELLGGLGDVLISLPAIQAFARTYPETHLTVLTFPPSGELLESDPFVHISVEDVPTSTGTSPEDGSSDAGPAVYEAGFHGGVR